jgi:hypothetical protein
MSVTHPVYAENFVLTESHGVVNIVFITHTVQEGIPKDPATGKAVITMRAIPVAQIAIPLQDFQKFAQECNSALEKLNNREQDNGITEL